MLIRSLNKCPLCENGLIFENLIKLNKQCKFCKYSFSMEGIGDLVSWITSFLVSVIIIPLVLILEFNFNLSIVEKVIVILPFIFFFSIFLNKYIKFFIFKKTILNK